MTVENALYPSQLNTAWPLSSDMVSEGDDHIRRIKIVEVTTWPNIAGVVAASHIELNYIVGVTSPLQGQINGKGSITGQTWTGAHVFSGSVAVPTLAQGTSTTGAASTAFVQNEWSTRLPNYTGPITASTAELNRMVGVTSGVQAQINSKATKTGDTYAGTHDFSGATSVTAPTRTTGDATSNVATTAFVAATAFSSALPGQAGNAGRVLSTNGTVASWTNTLTSYLSGPAGASGTQFPQAQEVSLRAPVQFDKTALMSNAPLGQQALYESTTGPGPDWPVGHPDVNAWSVQTTGVSSRAVQTASQAFSVSPGAGYVMIRFNHDSAWSVWSRIITDTTAMDKQVTVNVPAGTTAYTLDPSLGGSHVVTINGTCTFTLPGGRQYGDQVTLDVISAGAVRSIGFSENVVLPKDGSGANLPFPTYVAGSVISFVFRCILFNRWECYYAGIH